MKFKKLTIFLSLSFCLLSCREKLQYKTNDPFFIKAQKALNRGQLQQAVRDYERSLGLGKSYAAHLELAFIYEDLGNFTAAIYHADKFLDYSPADSERTALAKELKTQAEKQHYRTLSDTHRELKQPVVIQPKVGALGEMTKRERVFKEKYAKALKQREATKRELAKVKKELEEAKSTNNKSTATRWTNKTVVEPKTPQINETSFPEVVEQKVERKNLVPQPKVEKTSKSTATRWIKKEESQTPTVLPSIKIMTTYVVKKGDNLSAISQKFYGTSRNWKKILEANKPELTDPSKLKIGQTIKIPEIKK